MNERKICRSLWHWGELPEHQKRIMAQRRRTRRTQLMVKRWNKIINFYEKLKRKQENWRQKSAHNVKTFSTNAMIAWKKRKTIVMAVECRVFCNYSVSVIKSDIDQMGPQVVNAHTHTHSRTQRTVNWTSHAHTAWFEYFVRSKYFPWQMNANQNGNRMFSLPLRRRMIDKSFSFFLFRAETKKMSSICIVIGNRESWEAAHSNATRETSGTDRINCKIHKIVDDNFHTLLKLENRKRCGKLHKNAWMKEKKMIKI